MRFINFGFTQESLNLVEILVDFDILVNSVKSVYSFPLKGIKGKELFLFCTKE